MAVDIDAFKGSKFLLEGLGRVENVYRPRFGKIEFLEERSHRKCGLCEAYREANRPTTAFRLSGMLAAFCYGATAGR